MTRPGWGQVFLAELLTAAWRVLGTEVVLSSSFPFSGPVFSPQELKHAPLPQHTARGPPFLASHPHTALQGPQGFRE